MYIAYPIILNIECTVTGLVSLQHIYTTSYHTTIYDRR